MLRKIGSYGLECWPGIVAGLRRDAGIYGFIAAYSVFCVILLLVCGRPDLSSHANYFGQWTFLFLFLLPACFVALQIFSLCLRYPGRRRRALRCLFQPRRVAYFLSGQAMLMALMIFQGSFTSIKNLLPILRGGFAYDTFQADLGEWMHFGHAPWRLLYAYFADSRVLAVVEWNYGVLWFLLCFGSLFIVVTSPEARAIRMRYLTMFLFVWIFCGNVLAGLFLSAGPVFYGYVTGDFERYEGLRSFVADGGGIGSAADYQAYLWHLYQQGQAGFGSGISAFPSVHVALIAMNAFFFAERSPLHGLFGGLYTLFILASSVYLGWHYVIDGYASILVVGCAHFALRRWWVKRKMQMTTLPAAGNLPQPALSC